MKILITGGAGFIGSCFVRLLIAERPHECVLNLDKLTYAGNLENLSDVRMSPQHEFVHGDICDAALVNRIFESFRPDVVVHFAAESHVDRSILSPLPVIETNFQGTFTLLEAARTHRVGRVLHVSTDEVYGSLEYPMEADEASPLNPSSPYSAAKAASDLLVLSYFKTYRLPVIVTRASNNYGPYQFPEKLIPLMISNALENRPLPVYGDGLQVRDWLYVEDHCRAILELIERGCDGEIYNIAGSRSLSNLEVVRAIISATGRTKELIQFVVDRPGHDRRYALTGEKLAARTGWLPRTAFENGLAHTVDWYKTHLEWIQRVRSGEYRKYYSQNYDNRGSQLAGFATR